MIRFRSLLSNGDRQILVAGNPIVVIYEVFILSNFTFSNQSPNPGG
jgi:hypothetical protein